MNALGHYKHALRSLPEKFIFDSSSNIWISGSTFESDLCEIENFIKSHPRDLIVLNIENSYSFMVFLYGCLFSSYPVMLTGSKDATDLTGVLEAYQPGYIITQDDSGFEDYVVVKKYTNLVFLKKRTFAESSIVSSETALLLGTSGSTGSSKFVRLTLNNLLQNGISIIDSLNLSKEDRAITVLPTSYSYGLSIVNSHLLAGASLVTYEKGILGEGFWDLLRDQSVTSFAGVPYTFTILKRIGFQQLSLPSLKKVTQAGGRMLPDLIQEFVEILNEKKVKFYVMYGQTEATARISCYCVNDYPEKIGSVGKILKNGSVSFKEVGKDLSEVIYTGRNVMLGYSSKREDLILGDEMNGQLPTGDLGYMDKDGFLFLTGRSKRIAKVAGLRISLDEVEKLFSPLEIIALSKSDRIVICHSEGVEVQLKEMISKISQRLKIHKSFFSFMFTENIPRKPNGKIDYIELESLLWK